LSQLFTTILNGVIRKESDFELLTSGLTLTLSQGDKIQSIGPWIVSNHSRKLHKDLIGSFCVILLTDKQTNKHR